MTTKTITRAQQILDIWEPNLRKISLSYLGQDDETIRALPVVCKEWGVFQKEATKTRQRIQQKIRESYLPELLELLERHGKPVERLPFVASSLDRRIITIERPRLTSRVMRTTVDGTRPGLVFRWQQGDKECALCVHKLETSWKSTQIGGFDAGGGFPSMMDYKPGGRNRFFSSITYIPIDSVYLDNILSGRNPNSDLAVAVKDRWEKAASATYLLIGIIDAIVGVTCHLFGARRPKPLGNNPNLGSPLICALIALGAYVAYAYNSRD